MRFPRFTGFAGFLAFMYPKTIEYRAKVAKCYANSNNLPESGIKDVLTALQNAFGFRFMYDSETGSVSCLFVEDWIKQERTPVVLNARLKGEPTKRDHGIDGYRLKYEATDDDEYFTFYNDGEKIKVPKKVLRNGRYIYNGDSDDAHFNYKVFLDQVEGKATVSNRRYLDYARQFVTEHEKRVLIDQVTGKAYVVRIDEESEKPSNGLRKAPNPVLFEVGEFIPVEYGNCENEDRCKEVGINFTPVIMNNIGTPEDPLYALYIDGEWRRPSKVNFEIPTSVKESINPDTPNGMFQQLWEETLNLCSKTREPWFPGEPVEDGKSIKEVSGTSKIVFSNFLQFVAWLNYDMSGECPIYTNDAGFTLGVMRGNGKSGGSGGNEEIVVTRRNADGFGNDYIDSVQTHGHAEFHSDTIDDLCRVWDYNGDQAGIADVDKSIDAENGVATLTLQNIIAAGHWPLNGSNADIRQIMMSHTYLDIVENGWREVINKEVIIIDDEEEQPRNLGAVYICVPCVEVPISIYNKDVQVFLSIVDLRGDILSPDSIRDYAEELEGKFALLSPSVQQQIASGTASNDTIDMYMQQLDSAHLFVCAADNSMAVRFLAAADNLVFGQSSVEVQMNDVMYPNIIPMLSSRFGLYNYIKRTALVRTYGEMAEAGWCDAGDRSDEPVVAMKWEVINGAGRIMQLVDNSGQLLTKTEYESYIATMEAQGSSAISWDQGHKRLYVTDDLGAVTTIFGFSYFIFPLLRYAILYENNIALKERTEPTEEELAGRVSLYLKGEKPKSDINGKRTGEYFGATGVGAGRRGLFDRYHANMAYFETHCKEITLPVDMTLQDVLAIDMTKEVTVCGITGFIKEYECKYDNKGLSGVEITLLYL